MNSKFVKHIPCLECGSSDGASLYDDGHVFCYACSKNITRKNNNKEVTENFLSQPIKETTTKTLTPINPAKYQEISGTGITKETASFYGVWTNDAGETVYPYFSRDGKQHVANQFKVEETKGFQVQGEYSKTGLFGQQLFPEGSAKQITVVEGAKDALSAYQMQGSKWPVVSVKSASSAMKEIQDNFQYLNSFEQIVLCFDNDDPGIKAAEQCATKLPLGKVRIVKLSKAKDANDYLKNKWSPEFVNEWWKAKTWSPVGIRKAKDMWETVLAKKNTKYESIEFPWEGLNYLTYGLRTSELVTITANPKVGKTSILREIVFQILNKIQENSEDGRAVGLMFLEEPNADTLYGLMSLMANKPLHLPDVLEKVEEKDLKKYFDAVYGNDKVVVWDHWGSNEISEVLNYIRYMAALGCKYIILDHLSIIVSDQRGDERKQLDELSTKIKQLTMELDICVICVIHQNRKGEIRGTAGVEQLSNIVIKLYRDMLAEDEEIRNTMKVEVQANRFCGRTGPACLLKYDSETSRLIELPPETLKEYLSKKDTKGEEW